MTVVAIFVCDGEGSVGRPMAAEEGDMDLLNETCSFPARCAAAAGLGDCISGCCAMASLGYPLDWGKLGSMDIAPCMLCEGTGRPHTVTHNTPSLH